ncbi:unnamed protein product [Cuscuta campestris]|uniref:Integrase catalytic domain-containing protein n=1 Tax=Cuscuta campestris TaxID=132261 RepID=A0A484N6B4_9ASTE|nr:unnamed protein product [Cuscuta campestris]
MLSHTSARQTLNHNVKQLQRQVESVLARSASNPSSAGGPRTLETGSLLSKLKLEMPKTDGSDPLGWLFKAHEFFVFYAVPEESRLAAVSLMLEGPALDWFRWRQRNYLLRSWGDFITKFKLRFDPLSYVDYFGLLSKVQQTGSVLEYQQAFEKVLVNVTGVDETNLQSLFHAGLKPHLQHEVMILKPDSLSASFALAPELEVKYSAWTSSLPSKLPFQRDYAGPKTPQAPPPLLPPPGQKPPPGVKSTAPPPIRQLSYAEKKERDFKDVAAFRVYVGNGASLLCKQRCSEDLFRRIDPSIGIDHLDLKGADTLLRRIDLLGWIDHSDLRVSRSSRAQTLATMSDRRGSKRLRTKSHEALSTTPVLRLPDFSPFVVDTDASATGIGAVLLQVEQPVAYFSKKLGPRRLAASTYHKELYAIVEAVQNWRQYLLGREFLIRTDQRSLRELLHQVIQTPDQQFYVRKLLGRFGCRFGTILALSQPLPDIIEQIRAENSTQPDLLHLHQAHQRGTLQPPFSIVDGLLLYNTRLCIGADSPLRQVLLREYHDTPTAGHAGVHRTFFRLATSFYWPRMRSEVRAYVAACHTCQTTKFSTQPPGGLLQPLPVPQQIWEDVTMDFITGLPPSRGSSVILVVVDRLSKYAHFGPLPGDFDAHRTAFLFVDMVIKLHGFPRSIVSDRDKVFTSTFWRELHTLSGTTLHHCTAFHPQTDGQTEVMNRTLEQYLRAFVHARPKWWTVLLPWAKYSVNTSLHEGLKMTPFQAVYGRPPPDLIPYRRGASRVPAVDEVLAERDELLRMLRANLAAAQQRMKTHADAHRRDVAFKVGDLVLLKLQPYRQHSVARRTCQKLSLRYYGPFEILERIGEVAYRLKLLPSSRIHPVFHVAVLKPYKGPSADITPLQLPEELEGGRVPSRPVSIHASRRVLHAGHPVDQVLVRWSDGSLDDATWEQADQIRRQFPELDLEDKVVPQAVGNVTESQPPERKSTRVRRRPGW